jgi:hypothetical protein
VNHLLSAYDMKVSVDIGQGTRSYKADPEIDHPVVRDGVVLEGEGVSPVAVARGGEARVLIPLGEQAMVQKKKPLKFDDRNIEMKDFERAALAEQKVGEGSILVLFDRQPLWNSGPGSSIQRKDNLEILRRIIRYLAGDDPVAVPQ